jgi:hypothetical protein
MPTVTLKAHYDSQLMVLDEPFEIPPNSSLMPTVLPPAEPVVLPSLKMPHLRSGEFDPFISVRRGILHIGDAKPLSTPAEYGILVRFRTGLVVSESDRDIAPLDRRSAHRGGCVGSLGRGRRRARRPAARVFRP